MTVLHYAKVIHVHVSLLMSSLYCSQLKLPRRATPMLPRPPNTQGRPKGGWNCRTNMLSKRDECNTASICGKLNDRAQTDAPHAVCNVIPTIMTKPHQLTFDTAG